MKEEALRDKAMKERADQMRKEDHHPSSGAQQDDQHDDDGHHRRRRTGAAERGVAIESPDRANKRGAKSGEAGSGTKGRD